LAVFTQVKAKREDHSQFRTVMAASPSGKLLVKRRQSKGASDSEAATVAAYRSANPYASVTELAEVRAAEWAKAPDQVPYFELTVSESYSRHYRRPRRRSHSVPNPRRSAACNPPWRTLLPQ